MSLPCDDCGVDTTPEPPAGWEYYMVHDPVWAAAGMPVPDDPEGFVGEGILCIGCLEKRLGRKLTPDDFTGAPVNWPSVMMSARLFSRVCMVEV